MKTIGLIGGTSWISTQEYYKIINEKVNQKLGGFEFARIVLYSVNYGEIYACKQNGDQEGVYELLKAGAKSLKNANVNFIAICANTSHFAYEQLTHEIKLPFIHIADTTGSVIKTKGIKKVGLLGTLETMELDFYKKRLNKIGIDVIIPEKQDREFIHYSIMHELLKNNFTKKTKTDFISIMNKLKVQGAEGIILGCTEIPLLVKQSDFDLPLFSTLEIHAEAIVNFALKD